MRRDSRFCAKSVRYNIFTNGAPYCPTSRRMFCSTYQVNPAALHEDNEITWSAGSRSMSLLAIGTDAIKPPLCCVWNTVAKKLLNLTEEVFCRTKIVLVWGNTARNRFEDFWSISAWPVAIYFQRICWKLRCRKVLCKLSARTTINFKWENFNFS